MGAAVFPFFSLTFSDFSGAPAILPAGTFRDFVLVLFPDNFSGRLPADLLLVVKDVPPGFFFF
jgi:hypothetical protein